MTPNPVGEHLNLESHLLQMLKSACEQVSLHPSASCVLTISRVCRPCRNSSCGHCVTSSMWLLKRQRSLGAYWCSWLRMIRDSHASCTGLERIQISMSKAAHQKQGLHSASIQHVLCVFLHWLLKLSCSSVGRNLHPHLLSISATQMTSSEVWSKR